MFGKIVGGLETLNSMEKIEVDNKDRPIEDIVFQGVQVFIDPYEEADEQLAKERAEEAEKIAKEAVEKITPQKSKSQILKVYRSGPGKFLPPQKNEDK